MDVVIILVFASLVLVAAALIFFIGRLRDGDFDHGDRLSLLPLQDDEVQYDESDHTSTGGPVAPASAPAAEPDVSKEGGSPHGNQ